MAVCTDSVLIKSHVKTAYVRGDIVAHFQIQEIGLQAPQSTQKYKQSAQHILLWTTSHLKFVENCVQVFVLCPNATSLLVLNTVIWWLGVWDSRWVFVWLCGVQSKANEKRIFSHRFLPHRLEVSTPKNKSPLQMHSTLSSRMYFIMQMKPLAIRL